MNVSRLMLTILASAAVAACARTGGEKDEEAPGDSTAMTMVSLSAEQIAHGGVAWGPAGEAPLGAVATLPGMVQSNEDRTARIAAPARGRVMAVRVSPGERVSAGQSLIILESPEAGEAQSAESRARSAVAAARAQVAYATGVRQRADRLLALKAIPRQDYDRAVAEEELARSALGQAEADLRRATATARALGVDSLSTGTMSLRSPLDGVVLSRSAVPGDVVDAGAPLVAVTDLSTVWLALQAPESMTGSFRRGASLRFTVPAWPADTFTADIEAIGAGLDSATRSLPVRGEVRNAGGRLKPQMVATVLVEQREASNALVIPDEAVQTVAGRPVVFMATPRGDGGADFMAHEVATGPRGSGQITILGGISKGDIIVLRGAFAIKSKLTMTAMPDMEH